MRLIKVAGGAVAAVSVAVAFALATPTMATGNGATVLNHPDGLMCFYGAAGGAYQGPATLVQTPKGKVNGQCNARLQKGTPAAPGTKVTLIFATPFGNVEGNCTLTPSGNGNCRFSSL